MNKYIVNGQVAVIISIDYGSAWGSWYHDSRMFDPELAKLLESNATVEVVNNYLKSVYGYTHIFPALEVKWLPVGTEFIVTEYDGLEGLLIKNQVQWHVA